MEVMNVKLRDEFIKAYDASYEPKTVKEGSVVVMYIAYNDGITCDELSTKYICPNETITLDFDMDYILYEDALGTIIGLKEDETIQIGEASVTINSIYDSLLEYQSIRNQKVKNKKRF